MQGGGGDGNGESVEWDSHHHRQPKQQQKQQQQEQQQRRQWKAAREEDEEWSKAAKRRSSVWPLVATFITALAVGHIVSLRRRLLNFERWGRQEANSSKYESSNSHRAGSSSSNNGSSYYRTYWTYDGQKFYQREGFTQRDTRRKEDPRSKIWREGFFSAEDLERWERLRRMQEAFLRERAKYTRSYDGWSRSQTNEQAWRNDWERWRNTGYGNGGYQAPQSAWRSSYARHYEVLGLDPSKASAYSQAEIKAAYRARAMEYHPDRNQHRKAFAEEKFRDVVAAYEALKA